MRILYCSITYPPDVNGQAIFTQNLTQGMAACGHDVMVLTPSASNGQEIEPNPGIKVVRVRSVRLTRIHQDLSVSFFSRSLIRTIFDQFLPELIHIQDPSPLSQAVIREAHRRGIPVLITHHPGPEITSPYIRPENLLLKRILHWVGWKLLLTHLNQGDLVVVPSRYSAQMLAHHGVRADIRIVGCGVQLENFQPNPDLDCRAIRQQYGLDINKILFLYVGRIDYEKNLDTLICAIAALDRPDIQLAIAGQGKEKAHLQRLAVEVSLGQRVVFIGSIAHGDIPDLLNSSDAFVMPGDAESFSIATLEALACARPVLAAKAAALPELVAHQVNGYLFQPDQPEEAAAWIERLADHVEVRERMGASSLARAQHYSLSNMVRSYEQAYRSCRRADDNRAMEKAPLADMAQSPTKLLHKARRVIAPRLLVTLVIIFTLFFSTFLYDQAQARPNLQATDLTQLDVSSVQRLLVIAPHPDDETLAAGGLMQRVLEGGGRVEVVVVTNGDGQYLSPLLIRPWSVPRDADYVNLGLHRQGETLAALGQIGIDQGAVIFLGYPDGKLGELWTMDWPNDKPRVASYTHASSSPYQNTYNSQASYRGNDLFNDLVAILNDFQPDTIVVPHPEDTHSDHASVSDFTQFAIASYLASSGQTPPEILAYLVHYEGYPIPRGDNTGKYLLPPAALANYGEGWMTFSLSLEERDQKKTALNEYVSQLRSSGGYLRSFIRANEIFYELPTMDMPVASYESEAVLEDNMQAGFNLTEPSRERASRLMFSGADLVSWRAARLGGLICFGAEIRGPASKNFGYIVLAKLPDGSNLRISQPDDLVWFADQYFGACFDLDELGNPAAIGFSAETRSRNMLVDRTAWRFVYFPDY